MQKHFSTRHDALDALAGLEPRLTPSLYSLHLTGSYDGWSISLQGDSDRDMKALARFVGFGDTPAVEYLEDGRLTRIRDVTYRRVAVTLVSVEVTVRRVVGAQVPDGGGMMDLGLSGP